jgi:MFS family permease
LGTGVNVALAVPLDTAISKWFIKKRGTALSIKWIFSGISGVVVLPLVAWLITAVGWRSACLIGGLVMGLIGLPLVLLCFRTNPPEYYGLLPDGAKLNEEKGPAKELSSGRGEKAAQEEEAMIRKGIEYAAEVSEEEFTFKQSLRTTAYWLLILVQSVHGLVAPAINIHCISFLTDRGISPIVAAGMQAVMLTCSIPARFIGGFIADRIEKDYFRYYVAAATFLQALGIGIFMFHQTVTTIYIWFILYGIGMGAGLTLKPSMRARYFGRKAFGTIQGTSIMFLTPVGILAPIYAGWVFDTTGSYMTAFSLFTVLLTAASVIVYFIKPPKSPTASMAAMERDYKNLQT